MNEKKYLVTTYIMDVKNKINILKMLIDKYFCVYI